MDDKSKQECDQVIANIIYYLNIHKLIYNPFANKIFTDSKDSGSTNIKKNQIGEIEQIVKLIEFYNDKNVTPSKILYGNREEHSINFSNVVNHKILLKSILEKLIKMYISNSSYEYMVDNDGVLLISFAKNELPKDELPINEVHNDESSKVEKDKVLDYMFTCHCKRILENTLLIEYNIINTTSALENDINFEFADAYFPMLLRIMNEERGDGKTSKLKIELKSWIFPMYQYLLSLKNINPSNNRKNHQSDTKIWYLLFHYIMCFDFINESNEMVQLYKKDPYNSTIRSYMRNLLAE